MSKGPAPARSYAETLARCDTRGFITALALVRAAKLAEEIDQPVKKKVDNP